MWAPEWPQTPEKDASDIKYTYFSSFLDSSLPKNDQKRMIYVIFKKNLNPNLVVVNTFFKIVKKTAFNQFFELDDEEDGFIKRGTCFIQQIHLKKVI